MYRAKPFCYCLLIGCALQFAGRDVCCAASMENNFAHLSRVWQEEFSLSTDDNNSSPTKNDYSAKVHRRTNQPHPSVVRVIVPEQGATSYGSGTLIDVRDNYGLVITNWHVVRDSQGPVEVMFPSGFTSQARALKVDADWDLAALVIWRPPVQPVKIAIKPHIPAISLPSAVMAKACIDRQQVDALITTHLAPICLGKWSNLMSKLGRVIQGVQFLTNMGNLQECYLGQGRGPLWAVLVAGLIRS